MRYIILLVLLFFSMMIRAEDFVFCSDSYNACFPAPGELPSALTFDSLPEGARFFPDSGMLLWNPDDKEQGLHSISFKVTDEGETVKKSVSIRVKELEKVLCVFAHQDDEFGIIPKVTQLRGTDKNVSLLWTRGGNQLRNEESKKAMRSIGIPEENMHFWNFGGISSPNGFKTYVQKFSEFIKKHDFDQVYLVGYEGGHIEHDFTHVAFMFAARQAGFKGQIYEYGLYHLKSMIPQPLSLIPASSPTVQMALDNKLMNSIEALTDIYVSQKHVTDSFKLVMSDVKKSHPCYRPLPNWDYLRPASDGMLWYEINVKHPASFNKDYLPVIKAYLKDNDILKEQKIPYVQDLAESEAETMVLPEVKGAETVTIYLPYSIYVYSGTVFFFMIVILFFWLLYRFFKKRKLKAVKNRKEEEVDISLEEDTVTDLS